MARTILKYVGKTVLVILVTLLLLVGIVYLMLYKICNGPSQAAKQTFVTTILETGQLKFLASWVCTDEEIQEIVSKTQMKDMDVDIDEELIHIQEGDKPGDTSAPDEYADEVFDENGIRIEEINGRSFFAKMLIIKDPSQVKVACVADANNNWPEYGKTLDVITKEAGAVAAVNGGLYASDKNKGGSALGVVVTDGKIRMNYPNSLEGLYLIGLDNKNLLVIKDLNGMDREACKKYIEEKGIRDAVVFQEEYTDKNNHFVPLVINGEGRELTGQGSGANPRTAIGQRSDGAILLLVTDGRGTSGHLGATASDLIGVMLEYGAVNAANLDGGSSSCMYYNNAYEMNSVTFYYQNSSWNLPTSFVAMPKNK